MDGWMDGWLSGSMDGWMDGWMDGYGWMDRCMRGSVLLKRYRLT